jgi:hypothetical protein
VYTPALRLIKGKSLLRSPAMLNKKGNLLIMTSRPALLQSFRACLTTRLRNTQQAADKINEAALRHYVPSAKPSSAMSSEAYRANILKNKKVPSQNAQAGQVGKVTTAKAGLRGKKYTKDYIKLSKQEKVKIGVNKNHCAVGTKAKIGVEQNLMKALNFNLLNNKKKLKASVGYGGSIAASVTPAAVARNRAVRQEQSDIFPSAKYSGRKSSVLNLKKLTLNLIK